MVVKVRAELDEGGITPEKIAQMSDEEIIAHFELDGADHALEQVQAIRDAAEEAGSGYDMTVHLDDSQLEELTNPSIEINTDTAISAITEIKSAIEDLPHGKAHVDPETDTASAALSDIESQLNTISGINATPTVEVGGNYDTATTQIQSLGAAINGLHDKSITVTVNRQGGAGEGGGSGAAGINNHPEGSAFAGGTEGIPKKRNGKTLLAEEGYEILVHRDGQEWEVVDHPQLRDDVKPGDIVFDHEQSKKLLKNGRVGTHGQSFVGGTALASTDVKIKTPYATDTLTQAATQAQTANINAIKAGTAAKEAETAATQSTVTALDKFKQYLSNLQNWIEIKVDRLSHKMELAISRAENAVGYQAKNRQIGKAEKYNAKLQSTNEAAVSKYRTQAAKVATKARKGGLITKKQEKDLKKKIRNGDLSIEEFKGSFKKNKKGEDTSKIENQIKEFISAYAEWYQLSLDAEAAIEECKEKTKELAQTKLDNIVSEFEAIAGYAESISQVSAAKVSLASSSGKKDNSRETVNEYWTQIQKQNEITDAYRRGAEAY